MIDRTLLIAVIQVLYSRRAFACWVVKPQSWGEGLQRAK
jgi:hypothetical protein